MAAGFAMSKANIEGPGGTTYTKATIQVRANKLTIRKAGEDLLTDLTVTRAERVDRSHWKVITAAGEFFVTRDKDCGCAGSR